MRASIREATVKIRQSLKSSKKCQKTNTSELGISKEKEPSGSVPSKEPKDFAKASTTKRITDVVQAPPELTSLPRLPKSDEHLSSVSADKTKVKNGGVVSLAQKARMEEERQRVIKRYREMREGQRVGACM